MILISYEGDSVLVMSDFVLVVIDRLDGLKHLSNVPVKYFLEQGLELHQILIALLLLYFLKGVLVVALLPNESDDFFYLSVLESCGRVVGLAVETFREKDIHLIDQQYVLAFHFEGTTSVSFLSLLLKQIACQLSDITLLLDDYLTQLGKCTIMDLLFEFECFEEVFEVSVVSHREIVTVANAEDVFSRQS